jgi:hypothetical protein
MNKSRKNASARSNGCLLRRDEVFKTLGYDIWKQRMNIGRRWIAEIVFSIKRVLLIFSKEIKHKK